MTISEVIAKLQAILAHQGDLNVFFITNTTPAWLQNMDTYTFPQDTQGWEAGLTVVMLA
jgi:hypothetical protein